MVDAHFCAETILSDAHVNYEMRFRGIIIK